MTTPLPQVHHSGLGATWKGVERTSNGISVSQYRGIKYASIPGRFERATPVDKYDDDVVDATRFG